MANFSQTNVFNSLGTLSFNYPNTEPCFIEGKLSLPQLSDGASGASAVVVTINQNGSPKYVGQAGAEGFYVNLSCVANDLIAIVFSSAATVDQGLNAIKATIAYGSGM